MFFLSCEGHNGAGKSTLSNLISCEFRPTSGDVKVFGHSVTNETCAVRNLVGICRQDDYLYPNLTAKEHLELYAGLRGVPLKNIPSVVQEWLESVDLQSVQDHYSASYSGGMKRRLSLALATIGGRPLIILDEPTTGMDPVSRRFVWRHIDSVKEGRVILLTTHAMEEADLLADTVAIMRKGKFAAVGTPLELKAEHGSALQFSVLVEPELVSTTESSIRDRFAQYKEFFTLTAGSAGNLSANIRRVSKTDGEEGVDVDTLTEFVACFACTDELDLHVPKGQVIGLLGKNGAGKTTALKILSTAHDATDGVALVAGYNVNAEQRRVFEHLGNCPQFDVVWDRYTVEHHLVFFARLKGLPRKEVRDIAMRVANAVGLGAPEVFHRHVGQLSGGMRRRLSIAISLVGAPDVLLLDEPSTGLDPSTRNSIWGLIHSFATPERSIIITTHMMIEADTLCNRIAIMKKGKLAVVGTQQTLK
ncbi:predicted protein, partial [Phaeodactylum tricornutum CCAP 1055/1]